MTSFLASEVLSVGYLSSNNNISRRALKYVHVIFSKTSDAFQIIHSSFVQLMRLPKAIILLSSQSCNENSSRKIQIKLKPTKNRLKYFLLTVKQSRRAKMRIGRHPRCTFTFTHTHLGCHSEAAKVFHERRARGQEEERASEKADARCERERARVYILKSLCKLPVSMTAVSAALFCTKQKANNNIGSATRLESALIRRASRSTGCRTVCLVAVGGRGQRSAASGRPPVQWARAEGGTSSQPRNKKHDGCQSRVL